MKKLFSLHRVLLGILLVAAGVAAQAEDYQPPSEKERQAVKALSEAGASITLNANYQVSGVGFSFTASPTDPVLTHLAQLPHVESISIYTGRITDQGLAHLHGLKTLKRLQIRSAGITEAGIADLKKALPEC